MPATIHHLPVTQPHPAPSRWATAIATATLKAGCGPEKARSLVAGFEHAAELERDIVSAMAALRPGCAAPGPS
jgi:hypothetical protein